MILEHAVLEVKPDLVGSFLEAIQEAKLVMLANEGCRSLRVLRSMETPNRFVLLVEWDSVDAHQVGFRGTPAYEQWRALLHHHYEPMPVVEHYTTVVDESPHRYQA
ncbi:MAG: antibiotic biosynthesis monooxygenase family protein [Actinomycetota bacterium]